MECKHILANVLLVAAPSYYPSVLLVDSYQTHTCIDHIIMCGVINGPVACNNSGRINCNSNVTSRLGPQVLNEKCIGKTQIPMTLDFELCAKTKLCRISYLNDSTVKII